MWHCSKIEKLKNWKLEKIFLEIKNRPLLKTPRKSLSPYSVYGKLWEHAGPVIKSWRFVQWRDNKIREYFMKMLML